MLSEIGSNFWQYSLETPERVERLWWEKDEYKKLYFKSGRNAIKALCKILSQEKKSVLIPAYTCETVIQPFIDEGWEVNYYLLNDDLSLDLIDLQEKCEQIQPSVLYCHSYFGFDTVNEDAKIISLLKEQGIVIVEDITQSLFSNHYLSCADYYVTSLRKFLAIPDGGALISRQSLCFEAIKEANKEISTIALEAFDLKSAYFENIDSSIKDSFREKYQILGKLISENAAICSASEVSLQIFDSCNIEEISSKRMTNYKFLLSRFSCNNKVRIILKDIPDGTTPLYLPVYVNGDRTKLQEYLAKSNVYCPVIWPKPEQINIQDKTLSYMYQQMLCFPIDQRYGAEEMKKIVELLMNYKE